MEAVILEFGMLEDQNGLCMKGASLGLYASNPASVVSRTDQT
jgi:hypothetical protein